MKRLTFLATALASLFLAASCQQEIIEPVAQDAAVKFQVEVPGGMDTKAIADASEINVVHYEIYKAEKDHENSLIGGTALAKGHVEVDDKRAELQFDLLVDQEYVAIFWAQQTADKSTGENDFYVIDDLRTVSLKYLEWTTGNDESRAAFFRTYKFSTENVQDHKVTLYRPFAQLNLGTTPESLTPAQVGEEDGYTIVLEKSQVSVTGIATAFNTIAGIEDLTIDNNDSVHCGEAVQESTLKYAFDFKTAAVPCADQENEFLTVTDKNNITKEYKYVAMNYFFATNNVTVSYNIITDKGTVNNTVANVPVAENFRTNIIGNLLTSKTDFEIVVDARFVDSANNVVNPDENLYMVFDEHQLEDAIENITEPGDYTFYLGADMGGDIMITQKEGVNIVIDGSKKPATKAAGANFKYDGTITINGNARAKGEETLTIKNIQFESNSAKDFITAPTKIDGKYNYSHNVTVKECTFSSPEFNEKIVGIKLQTTYNASIIGCSAKNIHTLAQFYSTDNNTVIRDVKVENCKNGIALGNIANATITNAHISANGYGVRLDGEASRAVSVTITDSEINAYIPVTVRKMNNAACNATVDFNGKNILEGATYEVAFCSNEYEEGVDPQQPAGTFTLDGAEGYDVYYGSEVNSVSTFDAAINSTGDIEVKADITSVGLGFEVERDVVIDFKNNELNAGSNASSKWYALEIVGDNNVEINNANFTRAGILASNGADVIFNNGIINHKPERSSRYIFCALGSSTITIEDGEFSNDRPNNSYFWADNSTIYVNGGNFGGVASSKKVVLTNGGQLIITGGTFNFDPTEWVAENYLVEKEGSVWNVRAVNVEDIKEALSKGEDVTLSCDVAVAKSEADSNGYGVAGISQTNGGVIDGNGNAISVDAWGTWDSAINTTGGTIKNISVTGGMRGIFVNHNSKSYGKVYLDNVTIDGTIYTISCDQGTNSGLEAVNSTFNGWTSYAATIGDVKFTKCSFGEGQGYAFCRPYAPTEFVGCAFEAGYEIDARAAVSFENCTLNGEALTAENLATLVTGNIANATVK